MNPSLPHQNNALIHSTVLVERRWLSENAFQLELTKPPSLEFTPGQRFQFILENTERDYSVITSPDDPGIDFCIRKVDGGLFSPILAEAEEGSGFSFTGPYGYFTYRPSERDPVFVATGTGIAPFVSMARSGVTGFTLLHDARTSAELFYGDVFQKTAKMYVPCLSAMDTDADVPPDAFPGRVTEYLSEHLQGGAYDFYLCGRGDMIRDVTLLVDEHFPDSLVYTEIYY